MIIHKIDRSLLLKHDMAFNPSICRHEGKLFMAYRLEDRSSDSWSKIAICELNEEWQPILETNSILDIPKPREGTNLFEDPRLYRSVIDNKLMLSFIAARLEGSRHVACQGFILLDDLKKEDPIYPNLGNNLNCAFSSNSRNLFESEKNWVLLSEIS